MQLCLKKIWSLSKIWLTKKILTDTEHVATDMVIYQDDCAWKEEVAIIIKKCAKSLARFFKLLIWKLLITLMISDASLILNTQWCILQKQKWMGNFKKTSTCEQKVSLWYIVIHLVTISIDVNIVYKLMLIMKKWRWRGQWM